MREQGEARIEAVKSEIASLVDAEKIALIDELKVYALEHKWPARTILRIESGDLDNPMIQGILAKIYWKKTRDTEWLDESQGNT
jgi:hypothetical protein